MAVWRTSWKLFWRPHTPTPATWRTLCSHTKDCKLCSRRCRGRVCSLTPFWLPVLEDGWCLEITITSTVRSTCTYCPGSCSLCLGWRWRKDLSPSPNTTPSHSSPRWCGASSCGSLNITHTPSSHPCSPQWTTCTMTATCGTTSQTSLFITSQGLLLGSEALVSFNMDQVSSIQ